MYSLDRNSTNGNCGKNHFEEFQGKYLTFNTKLDGVTLFPSQFNGKRGVCSMRFEMQSL